MLLQEFVTCRHSDKSEFLHFVTTPTSDVTAPRHTTSWSSPAHQKSTSCRDVQRLRQEVRNNHMLFRFLCAVTHVADRSAAAGGSSVPGSTSHDTHEQTAERLQQ